MQSLFGVSRQEVEKPAHSVLIIAKIGWELPQDGAEFFPEVEYSGSEEIGERNVDVAQASDMRDVA